MGFLRLLLAVCVVLAHTGARREFQLVGAQEAVQIFFMISGFYMALILNEKYVGSGSYRLFITNRWLRIYPIYWAVLFLTAIGWIVRFRLTGEAGPLALFKDLSAPSIGLIATTNVLIFGQDVAMFTAVEHGRIIFTHSFAEFRDPTWHYLLVPQAWTLSVELLFYLCAPFLVRRSLRLLYMLLGASILLRLVVYFGLGWTNDPWTYRLFPTEAALFISGAIAYRLRPTINFICGRLLPFVGVAFIIGCIGYPLLPTLAWQRIDMKRWILYATAFAAIPALFTVSKNLKHDRYLGELSYPVYVCHWAVISMLPTALARMRINHGHRPLCLVASIGMSIILVHLISNPIENIRRRRFRQVQTKSTSTLDAAYVIN